MQDASESWRCAAAELETLCDALATTYWDAMRPEEATEEDAAELEQVLAALRQALQPWRREIIAAYRTYRTERGRRVGCREERLLGAVLPAIAMPRQADGGAE
jgi:uncharacterized protein with von Willebrand factor type A (vWA) domain